MTTTADWIAGARPRTLWTGAVPVLVGSASASAIGGFRPLLALIALGVALALQIGSNYANDYADGIRGTDVDRIGPERLVASGKALPRSVKNAAYASLALGAVLGLLLVWLSGQWWLLAVGAVAVIAAWTYTGSSRPYGYAGWGEVSVFIFFGPVAVLGTMYTQAGTVTWWAVAASAGVGMFSVALLLVNNIRDLATDALAGKRTLAVKLGEFRARRLFAAVVTLPIVCAVLVAFVHPFALGATFIALPALFIALGMRMGAEGANFRVMFAGISGVGLAYGLLLAVGIAI
ncbi:1,4-dihydroxy-2-naphthoate polyprenyltransferase [Demequina sp. SYSU T00039]|uniref:1,4-dihydroxy-2-naphthoate octaprenyltransferase n=1 Tax=Demequina lignilytica TaxID=3051663 RepID=A0AAW7MA44_9MICO|nr:MULTISPECIES: 1,4-dihydroxy-2-naphthoate polyprenyltransferase [unclassified Demequina]MDN4478023.1 1,4-dihydroxy-2-naphthoate polyprenyltransferase [Demequina sp. SYSU T00039-1]MDN4488527.1 1,4-dihydroxy-2-naphthoate polyprenyltransferase [Demequina sp. SYSU T00039]MDN4489926.1 1,4-dihydroxy-2-naphthoate polyprenyltransferase [Demequina sp. SYSU T00068]